MAGAWISTARRAADLFFDLFCPQAQKQGLKLEIDVPLRQCCLPMTLERFDRTAVRLTKIYHK